MRNAASLNSDFYSKLITEAMKIDERMETMVSVSAFCRLQTRNPNPGNFPHWLKKIASLLRRRVIYSLAEHLTRANSVGSESAPIAFEALELSKYFRKRGAYMRLIEPDNEAIIS